MYYVKDKYSAAVLDNLFCFSEDNLSFDKALSRYFFLLKKYPYSAETKALDHYLTCFVPDSYKESVVPKVLNHKLVQKMFGDIKEVYGPLSFEMAAFATLVQCNHAQVLEWASAAHEEEDLNKLASMVLKCADKPFDKDKFELQHNKVVKIYGANSEELLAFETFKEIGLTYEQAQVSSADITKEHNSITAKRNAIHFYIQCFKEQ